MFEIMFETGFPKHLVALLEALSTSQTSLVWNGRYSIAFEIERGVRQCFTTYLHKTTFIFNVYTTSVIREKIEELGIDVHLNIS